MPTPAPAPASQACEVVAADAPPTEHVGLPDAPPPATGGTIGAGSYRLERTTIYGVDRPPRSTPSEFGLLEVLPTGEMHFYWSYWTGMGWTLSLSSSATRARFVVAGTSISFTTLCTTNTLGGGYVGEVWTETFSADEASIELVYPPANGLTRVDRYVRR